ncbi:hypothetical protein CEE45_09795 [Candidatus Heimdallarchaeota archaeon B3_Heim]|nr:MAG: hypothetical protein CEE45_09795 [Candidatus Heimdallarchaeota archaeon B3_Heim]
MNIKKSIDTANQEALEKMARVQPILVDIDLAINVVPGMDEKTVLHAGPPIDWGKMSGPIKGAIAGILVYEGLADSIEDGYDLAASGDIKFDPNHDHDAVGPMTGITAPHQSVFILEDPKTKARAYCTLNEGRGKVLRFGGWGDDVLKRLNWMKDVLAPTMKKAIIHSKGIDIKAIISESLHMGDEAHNRNRSGTYLFLSELTPHLLDTTDSKVVKEVFQFIKDNADIFHLNLSMPHSKLIADAARDIEYCSLMVAMARNGTDIGIQVSGLGRSWFTSPATMVDGLYFPGYSTADACPDLGDSTISEVIGIGGFAMAASPAIVSFVGGAATDAVSRTERMYEITEGISKSFTIPILNFRGTPTGVDIRRVVELNETPLINTGIAHKDAGVGQIGAGLTAAPIEMFQDALRAFGKKFLS